MNFIDDTFNKELYINVTSNTFKNLEASDKDFLHDLLIKVLEHIANKFKFKNPDFDTHKEQLRVNNYRDAISLLLLLLPFIDDPNGDKKTDIRKLEDIYLVKKQQVDIKTDEPKYLYSNIQYGRCNRTSLEEIKFSREHILDNFNLLLDTISRVKNKLFINWINIFPVSSENNSIRNELIQDTKTKFKKLKTVDSINYTTLLEKNELDQHGINFEDIYNFYSNYVFNAIKNYKWLIYDVYFNGVITPYYVVLQKLLNLDKCVNNMSYNELDNDSFENSWEHLKDCISKNSPCNDIPIKIYFKIVVSMMYFFNKYSKNVSTAKKYGYKPFDADYLEEEQENIDKLRINYVWKSIKSLKAEYLYEFIYYQFKAYKNSIFSNLSGKPISKNRLVHSFDSFYKSHKIISSKANVVNGLEIITTDKNIYNFSKSITHIHNGSEYISMGRLWDDLTDDNKNVFLERLQLKTRDWFNIKGNLKRLNIYKSSELDILNESLLVELYINIPITVIDGLIKKGVLTYYNPNPETSKKDFSSIPGDVTKYFSENLDYLSHCYHFCNNTLFAELRIKTEDGDMSYFTYMSKFQKWYTTYAMNWVSQINFFHRYFNSRVLLVTGSTGVGKSTQIPKLLMYALKAVDYKEKGSVVCTQPRISPTEGNAKRIAMELGVPIESYNDNYKKYIPENNFNLQFKHQENSHTTKDDLLSLKICTDGTLMTELKNPLLKKRRYNEEIKKYEYFEDNIYDIVIVDEAHEHNTNMDVILTLMKYATYYNPTVKLVIVSATMDDDEPVYRRYYRSINDNLIEPINKDLEKFKLDRVNVDRRLHISPPGLSTRFKIDEIYKPGQNPVSICASMVKESSSGDFLLFQPGEKEIRETIIELNKILPDNTLAIPFLSKMKENKKVMVQNIEFNKHKLSRDLDLDYFFETEEIIGKGITRVVVVATNIAEASITIGSLRFVIDTGLEKIAKYDFNTGESKLIVREISESSRLQRKGRVGRTQSGTVVYTYEEGSKENIKSPFNISIDNVSTLFFDLLKEDLNEEEFKTPEIKSTYIGNIKHYDYDEDSKPEILYQTGYELDTVLDNKGKFYIVHPEELNFKRNITGTIVNKLNNEIEYNNNQIKSPKLDSFIDKLRSIWCIIKEGEKVLKTNFGIRVFKLKERLKLEDPRMIISYLFARQYGVEKEMESIIAILQTSSNTSPSRWFSKIKKGNYYQNLFVKYQKSYSDDTSDLIGLFNIMKKVVKIQDIDKDKKQRKIEKEFEIAKDFKLKYLDKQELPFEVYLMFKKMEIKGELVNRRILTEREKASIINDDNSFSEDMDQTETLANMYKIDIKTALTYRKIYTNLQNQLFKKINKTFETDDDIRNDDVDLSWYDEVLSKFKYNYSVKEGIVRSLLHSYNSLAFYVTGDYYCDLNNPDLFSLTKLKKFHPKLKILDSLLTKKAGIVLYFSKDSESNEIFTLTNVMPNQIMECNPLNYSEIELKERLNNFKKVNWALLKRDDKYKKLSLVSSKLINNLETVISALNKKKDPKFWEKLKDIIEEKHINNLKIAFKY
uniref:Helicase ATP-binding domain-containing protein n=1 Tax=viral metagenome TaxID=1070528 RepID=A0A6C0ACJ6_9ZZZZ